MWWLRFFWVNLAVWVSMEKEVWNWFHGESQGVWDSWTGINSFCSGQRVSAVDYSGSSSQEKEVLACMWIFLLNLQPSQGEGQTLLSSFLQINTWDTACSQCPVTEKSVFIVCGPRRFPQVQGTHNTASVEGRISAEIGPLEWSQNCEFLSLVLAHPCGLLPYNLLFSLGN